MKRNNTARLISDPINIRYLTGFMGLIPGEREAYCLLTNVGMHLFIRPLYRESAHHSVIKFQQEDSNNPINKYANKQINILELSREMPFEKLLHEMVQKNEITELEFETHNISVAEFEKLKKQLPGVTLVPSFETIENMRKVKTEKELKTIKKACTLTDACFSHLVGSIKAGQTESDIAWEIESFFHKNGATSSFSPIVAFNEHASEPHYATATSRSHQLSANSLILLDFGATVDGYSADMTRVVFLGTPKSEWIAAYETVLNAQTNAIECLKTPSPSGAKADERAKKCIIDAGYPAYPHGLGHGVGLAIHEAPRLSVSNDEPLSPGNVFSVEPGIYIQGTYGIRIEDLVVLTDTGIDILSNSKKGLTIL